MPTHKLVCIGVWENQRFIGAVIYGCGAGNSTDGRRYGLAQRFEVAELVRVALDKHESPTSKIVAISISMLRKIAPNIKLLTSFADSGQGHFGIIYQASGWIYVGSRIYNDSFLIHGKKIHCRTVHMIYGSGAQSEKWLRKNIDPNAERLLTAPKHHYLYPLSNDIRLRIEKLRKPYPKRATSRDDAAPGDQPGEGGLIPTVALQTR